MIVQRIVLLVLTNSPQCVHSTKFTHVSSRRSSELEKILTIIAIDDRMVLARATSARMLMTMSERGGKRCFRDESF